MKPSRQAFLLAAATLVAASASFAASGTWTNTAGGTWSTTGNWSGGTVADGNTFTADFNTLDITADTTVQLDTARTLTGITFGDAATGSAANWILGNNSNVANTLTVSTITVNALDTGSSVTTNAKLIGNGAMTVTGAGILNINGGLAAGTSLALNGGINALYNSTGGTISNFTVGGASNANFTMSGGDLTVSGTDLLFCQGGTTSNFTQTGGTLNLGASFFKGANAAGQTGTISVSGGTWTQTGTFMTNQRGTGTLTVSGDANMSVGLLGLGGWVGDAKIATVNLDGGTLAASAISEQITNPSQQGANSGTTSTFNFNGGTLKATTSTTTFMVNVDNVVVKSGGAKIDTNGSNITIGKALTHDATLGLALDGGLTKSGTGTLTLSGTNTYNGGTTINGGTLKAGSAGAFGSGAITVNAANTGTLDINGLTLTNATTVNGGTLAGTAGSKITGTVTVGGAGVLIASGASITLKSVTLNTGAITTDGTGLFANAGTLAFDGTGTLDLNNCFTGYNGGASGSYKLISNAVTGGFTSITNAGANWNSVTFDAATGTLNFTAVPEPSTYGLLGAGALAAAAFVRRRRRHRTAA